MEKWIKRLKSWQTTLLGVIAALVLILPQLQAVLDADPATVASWEAIATGLGMLGIGAVAKDGDKSTEDVSE